MRWVCAIALLTAACASTQVVKYDEMYKSDTFLVDRLMTPMGVEPPHGQVTVVIASGFTEKLLRASVHPNVLALSVVKPGPVWKQQFKKLFLSFDNEVDLKQGKVDVKFTAEKLDLHGDLISLHGHVEGRGDVLADMRFFGVGMERDVEVATKFDDALQFQLERGAGNWNLRLIGPPLKVHVDVKIPALAIGVYNIVPVSFSRDLEFPADSLGQFALPSLTPQTVNVGPATMALGVQNMSMGTHDGLLWMGADLFVQDAPVQAPALPSPHP